MLALREFEKVDGSRKIQTDIRKKFSYKVEMLVLPIHDMTTLTLSILQLTHTY
jgi:hypothetical protein